MGDEDIVLKINNLIIKHLAIEGVQADTLKPDAHLVEDLGGDSLDLVELTMALEEEFNITIEDDFTENIATVNDIHAGIVKLVKKK